MVFRKHFVLPALFFTFSLLFLSLSGSINDPYEEFTEHSDPERERLSPEFSAANAAAMHWINLVDQFQFGPSWLDAGNMFKDIITEDQWVAAMNGVRRPYGYVTSRQVENQTKVPTLPLGTQGSFIVITYRTDFSNKSSTTETIAMVAQGPNQLWKVVHYQIGR